MATMNTSVWSYWNDSTTASNYIIDTNNAWKYWSTSYPSSTSTSATVDTAGTVWSRWLSVDTSENYNAFDTIKSVKDAEKEMRRLAAEQERERKKRILEVKKAEERAWILFRKALTTKQLQRFKNDQCIEVDSPSGKKYLIDGTKYSGNVFEMVNGEKTIKLCAHIRNSESCPLPDHLLAQKLYLEHAEEEFLHIANKTVLVQANA